jgi:hypothetical protein
MPKYVSSVSDLEALFSSSGWSYQVRTYVAPSPLYPVISPSSIIDNSYPRSFYTLLANAITTNKTLEEIRTLVGNDFYYNNYENITTLHG